MSGPVFAFRAGAVVALLTGLLTVILSPALGGGLMLVGAYLSICGTALDARERAAWRGGVSGAAQGASTIMSERAVDTPASPQLRIVR